MPARWRKLFGTGAILAFMAAYIWAAAIVGDYLPRHWAIQLAYFVVAGTAWAAPLIPLVIWMNRGR